jgi:hypothetical protein
MISVPPRSQYLRATTFGRLLPATTWYSHPRTVASQKIPNLGEALVASIKRGFLTTRYLATFRYLFNIPFRSSATVTVRTTHTVSRHTIIGKGYKKRLMGFGEKNLICLAYRFPFFLILFPFVYHQNTARGSSRGFFLFRGYQGMYCYGVGLPANGRLG